MRPVLYIFAGVVLALLIAIVGGVIYLRVTGLQGHGTPGAVETRFAGLARGLAIPGEARARTNPLTGSEDAFWSGLEHYAKYCTPCHANDGSGLKTAYGQGLFPKPPDLREIQDASDGELFYIIENGIRFTGMPAFGTGKADPAGERQVWQLVTFLRRLPKLTKDELGRMEALNVL
jgi:mono/diheme cytochrome c family protein